jgi:hypothetical protein
MLKVDGDRDHSDRLLEETPTAQPNHVDRSTRLTGGLTTWIANRRITPQPQSRKMTCHYLRRESIEVTNGPVRLVYATSQKWAHTSAIARVQNIAYNKSVVLHLLNGGRWLDIPLHHSFYHGNYDEYSVDDAVFAEQLTIRASINGVDYWDNNGGRNYLFPLQLGGGNVVGGDITWWQGQFTRDPNTYQLRFHSEVRVSNLSYRKNVGIRLIPGPLGSPWSSQGGGASLDLACRFQGLVPEWSGTVESWISDSGSWSNNNFRGSVYLAAYYEDLDRGNWYWDNNFGQNYALIVP